MSSISLLLTFRLYRLKILPALYPLLKQKAFAVCLIKPQFEAGKEKVGKKRRCKRYRGS